MIHGKLTCPNCNQVLELSATKAPAQQSQNATPTGSIGALLDSIDAGALTGKAAEFVAETRARYAKYKERTLLSEKQRAWLESIASGESNEW